MKTLQPLTSAEAALLCSQFSSLKGKTLVCEPTDFFLIEHVVQAPFSETDKNLFAMRFIENQNSSESASFYEGAEFDVLVFARNVADKSTVLYESLQDYLQHEHIDLTADEIPSYII